RQPVAGLLIERSEDARIVRISRPALQESFSLLSPVAAEISMQQIHHRPQMAPLLDIHLEQIAQIVKRRTGRAQQSLLFHRGRSGISLLQDDSPQRRSVFSRNILPGRLAPVISEMDFSILVPRRQKNAPSILRHADVSEIGPSVAVYTYSRSQVHLQTRRIRRTRFAPPVQEGRLPAFERALQGPVVREIDIVRNAL